MRIPEYPIILYIMIILLLFVCSLGVFVIEMTIEPEYIPSILEGLTSSISIMIGFTATILAIMFQRSKLRLSPLYLELVITAMMLSICVLFLTYFTLVMQGNFQQALRYGMFDLILTFCILTSLLNFLYIKIRE